MNITTQAEERGTTATPVVPASFNRTAAGAAALGAVFTLPVAVDAAIVYSGIQNVTVTLPASQRHASNNSQSNSATQAAPLDIDGNAVNDFEIRVGQQRSTDTFSNGSTFFSTNIDRQGAAALFGLGGNLVRVDGFEAINFGPSLEPSNAIGPFFGGQEGGGAGQALLRSAWSSYSASGTPQSAPNQFGNFSNGVAGVAGVKFYRAETGQNHYGWIRLIVDDGGAGYPYQVTAVDWAWETSPETPFHYGNPEIPEANPGLILLAAGGTGLAAWRMRRRQAAKAAAQA